MNFVRSFCTSIPDPFLSFRSRASLVTWLNIFLLPLLFVLGFVDSGGEGGKRFDSNSMDSLRLSSLQLRSKIRAVNDSVRILKETFYSRCGVVKLFTTLIRRYNGAAGYYRPFE